MDIIQELIFSPLGTSYKIGNLIWQLMWGLIRGVVSTTPQAYSGDAWGWVATNLYPWAQGLGALLLNLFYLTGLVRETSNLKETGTIEIIVMGFIKLLVANAFLLSGLAIMEGFFNASALLANDFLTTDMVNFTTDDVDGGTFLFFFIFGVIYAIVATVCAGMILLAVYGRYIKLYMLVVSFPIAFSALAGGRGLENTAYAWVKTFLVHVFEIVVIAMVLNLCNRLIGAIDFAAADTGGLGSLVDGFLGALQSMLIMVLMASSVKGTENFLRRTFGL